jgi:hypothetical protein
LIRALCMSLRNFSRNLAGFFLLADDTLFGNCCHKVQV